MSCGCQPTTGGRLRTSVLMCDHCPQHTVLTIRGEPTSFCRSVDRRILVATESRGVVLAIKSCPMGRHPDRRHVVRWHGPRWIGLPAPIRWQHRPWSVWLTKRPVITREPEGCGCLLVLKRLSLELCVWQEAATFDAFGRGGPPWHRSTWAEASRWARIRTRQAARRARRWARRPATP